jgi:hypothetical protein
MGACPACTTTVEPPSITSSTASPLHSASSAAQVTRPSALPPPGQVMHAAKRQHLRPVFGGRDMADTSPSARTTAPSGPRKRSVSIFTLTPQ